MSDTPLIAGDHPLYRHPKIDTPIYKVLRNWGMTDADAANASWQIQHHIHCEGVSMFLHGERVQ